jgi:hypothetical protein
VEREAGRKWWYKSDRQHAFCDACNDQLSRDDGYAIDGRLILIEGHTINLSGELLCESCFNLLRDEPRDPGAKAREYLRVDPKDLAR